MLHRVRRTERLGVVVITRIVLSYSRLLLGFDSLKAFHIPLSNSNFDSIRFAKRTSLI